MFYYVNGTVAETGPNLAVIDCGGVGYACATTNYTLSQLKKGERAKLYTYMNVREDAVDLFGFSSQSELHSFKLLLGVSGVGPKAALAILSTNTPANLAMAVVMGDEKALTAAPGVGKKIAQRIILELRDKVTDEDIGSSFGEEQGTIAALGESAKNTAKSEAISALVALGYGQTDAAAVIAPMEESLAVDELIRRALKAFTRGK